jgi:hypothetical protein
MKDPNHFVIDFNDKFIGELELAQLQIAVVAKHLVMISCHIDHSCSEVIRFSISLMTAT